MSALYEQTLHCSTGCPLPDLEKFFARASTSCPTHNERRMVLFGRLEHLLSKVPRCDILCNCWRLPNDFSPYTQMKTHTGCSGREPRICVRTQDYTVSHTLRFASMMPWPGRPMRRCCFGCAELEDPLAVARTSACDCVCHASQRRERRDERK